MIATHRHLVASTLLAALLSACGGERPGPSAARPPPAPASDATSRASAPPDAACSDPGAGPPPDAAGLRAFVRRRSRELRDCYQRALKRDASAGGKATLRFTIGPCGQLSDVAVSGRRGKVDEAAACAIRVVQAWRTPFRPAEPVAVEYPISFSASM